VAQAQQTLAAMLFAFGVAQLFWGPLSDRFGRKRLLVIAIVTFGATSLLCGLAPNMITLIAGRALQGSERRRHADLWDRRALASVQHGG